MSACLLATGTTWRTASRSSRRRSRHCPSGRGVVDGEAIGCDDEGLVVFDLIRGHATNAGAVLCAFDLLEVNGEDVRREPIEDRKRRLAGPVRLQHDGMALNEAFSGDGAVIYKHACALGCEGIVSKRVGSSIAPAARRTG